jgi:hypothetical protein
MICENVRYTNGGYCEEKCRREATSIVRRYHYGQLSPAADGYFCRYCVGHLTSKKLWQIERMTSEDTHAARS